MTNEAGEAREVVTLLAERIAAAIFLPEPNLPDPPPSLREAAAIRIARTLSAIDPDLWPKSEATIDRLEEERLIEVGSLRTEDGRRFPLFAKADPDPNRVGEDLPSWLAERDTDALNLWAGVPREQTATAEVRQTITGEMRYPSKEDALESDLAVANGAGRAIKDAYDKACREREELREKLREAESAVGIDIEAIAVELATQRGGDSEDLAVDRYVKILSSHTKKGLERMRLDGDRRRLNDDDVIDWPNSEHYGKRLGDVPDEWFLWFLRQTWSSRFPDLVEYAKTVEGDLEE